MYFWRIRRLRQQLIESPLSQPQALAYVLAVTFFYTMLCLLFSAIASFTKQPLISIYILIFFATKFVGIPLCYYFNGGKDGKNFMQRYFSMAWVQILRFVVFGIIILILFVFVLELFIDEQILQSPHFIAMGIFLLLWQVVYYWRMCFHFKFVSMK